MNHGGIRRPVNRDGRYTKIMTVLWRNSSPEKRRMTAILRSPFMMQFWDGFGKMPISRGGKSCGPSGLAAITSITIIRTAAWWSIILPFRYLRRCADFFQSRNISFFSVRAASDVAQSGRHELDRHSVRRSGDIRKRGMRRYVVCQQPFRRHSYYDRARPARPHQKCRKNEATTYGFAKIHLPGQCGIRRIVGQDSPYVKFEVRASECRRVRKLDNQKGGEVFMEADISFPDKATARKIEAYEQAAKQKTDYHRIGITRNPATNGRLCRSDAGAGYDSNHLIQNSYD